MQGIAERPVWLEGRAWVRAENEFREQEGSEWWDYGWGNGLGRAISREVT